MIFEITGNCYDCQHNHRWWNNSRPIFQTPECVFFFRPQQKPQPHPQPQPQRINRKLKTATCYSFAQVFNSRVLKVWLSPYHCICSPSFCSSNLHVDILMNIPKKHKNATFTFQLPTYIDQLIFSTLSISLPWVCILFTPPYFDHAKKAALVKGISWGIPPRNVCQSTGGGSNLSTHPW